ncbi:MAG: helix-turn-helix transcriptional regulator [Bacteroides sp.]|nr:helix-turn-helix transcriptional regulator [Bacteroides sp.]
MARSSFLRTLTKEAKPPRGVNTTLLHPVTALEADQFQLIKTHLERLRWRIDRKEHLFHAKLVENEFVNFILELWNFRAVRTGIQPLPAQKPGNREHIAAEFLRLLCTHIQTEREVAFYANLLCVTPIYLSRAVKHVLGVPPMKVINELILSEALILLRKRELAIGHVADALNFPDPASFSKFFKKSTGQSPMEYRNHDSK